MYDPFNPPWAAKQEVVSHAAGVFDPEVMFYPRRQARKGIALGSPIGDIAEIMGEDDVVQRFLIYTCILNCFFSCEISQVGGIEFLSGITSFSNAGNCPEFLDYG